MYSNFTYKNKRSSPLLLFYFVFTLVFESFFSIKNKKSTKMVFCFIIFCCFAFLYSKLHSVSKPPPEVSPKNLRFCLIFGHSCSNPFIYKKQKEYQNGTLFYHFLLLCFFYIANSTQYRNLHWRFLPKIFAFARFLDTRVRILFFYKKQKEYQNGTLFVLAAVKGFEPLQTESESGVLPLHYTAIHTFRANTIIT